MTLPAPHSMEDMEGPHKTQPSRSLGLYQVGSGHSCDPSGWITAHRQYNLGANMEAGCLLTSKGGRLRETPRHARCTSQQ